MNSTAKAIRYWLMKRPRPAYVLVVVGKETSEMTFDARTSFARTAESLEAMDADQLRALDPERKLIRACKPAELEEDTEPEVEEPEAPPPPVGAVVTDPETARFVLVANLLADAYKHATGVAFDKLADITDRMVRRHESTERTVESLRRHMLAEAQARYEESVEKEPGILEQAAAAFAGGMNLGGASAAAQTDPPKPNGKH